MYKIYTYYVTLTLVLSSIILIQNSVYIHFFPSLHCSNKRGIIKVYNILSYLKRSRRGNSTCNSTDKPFSSNTVLKKMMCSSSVTLREICQHQNTHRSLFDCLSLLEIWLTGLKDDIVKISKANSHHWFLCRHLQTSAPSESRDKWEHTQNESNNNITTQDDRLNIVIQNVLLITSVWLWEFCV